MGRAVKSIALVMITVMLALGIFSGCGGDDEVKYYSYSPGDTFVTNLKESKKLVSCNITIEATSKKDVDKFTEKNYVIRDTIIAILRDQDEDTLKEHDIQSKLSDMMVEKLNEALEIKSIYKIYFEGLVAN